MALTRTARVGMVSGKGCGKLQNHQNREVADSGGGMCGWTGAEAVRKEWDSGC